MFRSGPGQDPFTQVALKKSGGSNFCSGLEPDRKCVFFFWLGEEEPWSDSASILLTHEHRPNGRTRVKVAPGCGSSGCAAGGTPARAG